RKDAQQTAHGAHAAWHADDADADAALRRQFGIRQPGTPLEDGIDVGHGLRWMFIHTVSRIDDGYAQASHHLVQGLFAAVTQHHTIGVVIEHFTDIFERLALCYAGRGTIGDAHDVATQSMPGAFEGESRTRARLIEGTDQNLALKWRTEAARIAFVLGREAEQL